MIVNQRFGLITLHFSRVIRVAFEVAPLKDRPIDFAKMRQIAVIVCPIRIGMCICEDKR
ncbi:hypothetical protein D3C78_1887250 [compost metagenome]